MYKNSVQRFREIVKVLAFYGFGFIVDSKLNNETKSPQNLRKAFEELGPTFIKIGQILSTRPDILPAPYITELSKLQDSVPAEKFEDIDNVFFNEFDKSINDTFKHFDKKPLASASIAQVHKAIMKNGREVIVKVQRPDIYEKMNLDLNILHKILKLSKAKFADALIDPLEALDEIRWSTELELDFKIEANNICKFRELNYDVAFVYAPFVISDLSSSKVLTMEEIDGFKINDIRKLNQEGYDPEDVGRKLALSFFKQVFTDGFFHGDPHPGNILIRGGKIAFIDFGIMGSFTKDLKAALNDAIIAVAYKDPDKLISVVMSIGIKKGFINRNKLYEEIDYLFASYLSTSLHNIEMSVMLQEIFDCCKRNNVFLPKDLTLLIRSLVIIEGVIAKICPELKILDVAIPFVKSNNMNSFLNNISFDELLIKTTSFIRDSAKIPTKIVQLSDSILNGRTKIQFQISSLNKTVNDINKMTNRVVISLIISSMIIGSSLILNSNIGPDIYGISIIGILGFGFAAIMGLWLIISILRSGKL